MFLIFDWHEKSFTISILLISRSMERPILTPNDG
eukprot:UN06098